MREQLEYGVRHRGRVVGDRGQLRRCVAHRGADLVQRRGVAELAARLRRLARGDEPARAAGREVGHRVARELRGGRVLALPAVRLGLIEQQRAERFARRATRDTAPRTRRGRDVIARDQRFLRGPLVGLGRARSLAAALEVLRERDRFDSPACASHVPASLWPSLRSASVSIAYAASRTIAWRNRYSSSPWKFRRWRARDELALHELVEPLLRAHLAL